MDVLINIFKTLELSKLHSLLYWELLTKKHINICRVAEKFDTNRPNIYKKLQELILLGLIDKVDKTYIAKPPKYILYILKNKQLELKNSIHTLEKSLSKLNFYIQNTSTPSIEIVDFCNLPHILLNLLDQKNISNLWWFNHNWGDVSSSLYKYLGFDYFQYLFLPKRLKLKIDSFILAPHNNQKIFEQKERVDYHNIINICKLPEKYNSLAPVTVFGEHVIHFDLEGEKAKILYNCPTNETFRKLFQDIWNSKI